MPCLVWFSEAKNTILTSDQSSDVKDDAGNQGDFGSSSKDADGTSSDWEVDIFGCGVSPSLTDSWIMDQL